MIIKRDSLVKPYAYNLPVKGFGKNHENSSPKTFIVQNLLPFLIKRRKSSLNVKIFFVATEIRGQVFILVGGSLMKHNSLKKLGHNLQKVGWYSYLIKSNLLF